MQLTIVFKIHHLVHYPRQVKFFGGMKRSNTCRYERAHQIFTNTASTSKNRVNLPITFIQNYIDRFLTKSLVAENIGDCGKFYTKNQLSTIIEASIYSDNFDQTSGAFRFQNCSIAGIDFSEGNYFAIKSGQSFFIVKISK